MSTVPTTGELRFSTVRAAFSGTTPIKLSDYFANALANLTTGVAGIPSKGAEIRMNLFRGKRKVGNGLYTFLGHTFATASATGRLGPTLSQCRSAYSSTEWASTYLNMASQGIQEWTVPATGSYTIDAAGAAGGCFSAQTTNAGRGVIIRCTVNLNQGNVLYILVGQKGSQDVPNGSDGCSGGGGTFVALKSSNLATATPIIVAGAGGGQGGCSFSSKTSQMDASYNTSGNSDSNSSTYGVGGGSNGGGGGAGPSSQLYPGAGGGGFYGDGSSVTQTDNQIVAGGTAFVNGGTGTTWLYYSKTAIGGFGGGGSTGGCGGGGGGGYSGGAGGFNDGFNGGGGGSYASTSATNVGYNSSTSDGYVIITPNFAITSSGLFPFSVGASYTIRPLTFGSYGMSSTRWNTVFSTVNVPWSTANNSLTYVIHPDEQARGNPQPGVMFGITGFPDGVYEFTLRGGGGASADPGYGAPGGIGVATMAVSPSDTLYFLIGQGGVYTGGADRGTHGGWYYPNPGGWNGGGAAGAQNSSSCFSGSGGGSTDVRLNGTALSNRILVVGGGGGSSDQAYNTGGAGGGFNQNGQNGGFNGSGNGYGRGGSSVAGGSGALKGSTLYDSGMTGGLWYGGRGYDGTMAVNSVNAAGGGGGGYYGGGGAVDEVYPDAGGAGGGSGYADTNKVSVTSSSVGGANNGHCNWILSSSTVDSRGRDTCGFTLHDGTTNTPTSSSSDNTRYTNYKNDGTHTFINSRYGDNGSITIKCISLSSYSFTIHTFTTAGTTGRFGPTLSQLRSAYTTAQWTQSSSYLNITIQGVQEWTVPISGSYTIECAGAQGGGNSSLYGRGAVIKGTFNLTRGTVLCILVGHMGGPETYDVGGGASAGGGGGGTFISQTSTSGTLLMVAGGGGGRSRANALDASYNQTDTFTGSSSMGAGTNGEAYGGAGYSGETANSISHTLGAIARSFLNAGAGGLGSPDGGQGFGGFGGGGGEGYADGGGGGGYTGGNSGTENSAAGGGGSHFNTSLGTNRVNVGYNAGHGYVTIAHMKDATNWITPSNPSLYRRHTSTSYAYIAWDFASSMGLGGGSILTYNQQVKKIRFKNLPDFTIPSDNGGLTIVIYNGSGNAISSSTPIADGTWNSGITNPSSLNGYVVTLNTPATIKTVQVQGRNWISTWASVGLTIGSVIDNIIDVEL